jgi:hypothetical protein
MIVGFGGLQSCFFSVLSAWQSFAAFPEQLVSF